MGSEDNDGNSGLQNFDLNSEILKELLSQSNIPQDHNDSL